MVMRTNMYKLISIKDIVLINNNKGDEMKTLSELYKHFLKFTMPNDRAEYYEMMTIESMYDDLNEFYYM